MKSNRFFLELGTYTKNIENIDDIFSIRKSFVEQFQCFMTQIVKRGDATRRSGSNGAIVLEKIRILIFKSLFKLWTKTIVITLTYSECSPRLEKWAKELR